MEAIWFDRFGSARDVLQVGELEDPRPGQGEVVVKVLASAVNPSDVKKRSGSIPGLLDEGFVIPHSDGAGVIEDVGVGVSRAYVGRRVWVFNAQYQRRLGTGAEFCSVPLETTVGLPDASSFEVGACMGIPAMTAHRAIFSDGPVKGQNVLVTGGAGRVGYYSIQLAKLAGARVYTTVGSEKDRVSCAEVGADTIIDHKNEHWSQHLGEALAGERIDRVIEVDFGANLEKILPHLRIGATIATYSSMTVPNPSLPFFRMMYLDLSIRTVIVYAMPPDALSAAHRDITQLLQDDLLVHRIAETRPMSEAVKAHESVEAGRLRGTCILKPSYL